MKWNEIREKYPNQWLVVEAIEAVTTRDQIRKFNKLSVIEQCKDGISAFHTYADLHKSNPNPNRECFYVHTSREDLEIKEETCLGLKLHNEI